MNLQTGRPDHISDWLVEYKEGQWYSWTDSKDKVYANLITRDGSTKPTEAECSAGRKALQDAWDDRNAPYKLSRRGEYPSTADQLDDIYHNGIDGWKATIKAIKDKYPKE